MGWGVCWVLGIPPMRLRRRLGWGPWGPWVPYAPWPPWLPETREGELEYLRELKRALEQELKWVEARIRELEKQG